MALTHQKYRGLASRIVIRIVRNGGGIVLAMLLSAASAQAGNFVTLTGNHPEAAADLAATGTAVAPYQMLQMEIYLKPRNQAQLDKLEQEQQDPSSPEYHKWLTPEEYDQQFGPTAADVSQVSQWLTSQDFTVTYASAQQGRIKFEGNVANAQTAFNVDIKASSDGKHFGNVEDPQVPASLAPKISFVSGLDNLHATIWHAIVDDPPYPNDGITNAHFGPPDIWTFSDATPTTGADGTGQCIAVSEGSDVDQTSLALFNTIFNLPQFIVGTNYASVFPDGSPGTPGSEGGGSPYDEAMLDVEYAHAIAPGAEIVLYAANAGQTATSPVQALVDTADAAVTDTSYRCASLAISWAQCGEPPTFYKSLDKIFARGAAEGQSIFVATGDVGVAAPTLFNRKTGGCQVPSKPEIEENAGSPHVTAVGASMFTPTYDNNGNDTSTAAGTTQQVWSFNLTATLVDGASTGGYSQIFGRPAFQKGVKTIKGSKRAVPDIVLGGGTTVFPGFWECLDFGYAESSSSQGPTCTVAGGTSIVPPQYAGIFAIVAEKTGAKQGLVNTKLYEMAEANLNNLSAAGIEDITTGNNSCCSLDGYTINGYSAGPGFDLASGWGAIDVNQFITSYINYSPVKKKK